MKCPGCGEEVNPEAIACPNCKRKVVVDHPADIPGVKHMPLKPPPNYPDTTNGGDEQADHRPGSLR